MRGLIAAVAVLAMTGPAAGQDGGGPDWSSDPAIIRAGEMALMLGVCEEHLTRDQADGLLRALTQGKPRAELEPGDGMARLILADAYIEGRLYFDERLSRDQCERVLNSYADD